MFGTIEGRNYTYSHKKSTHSKFVNHVYTSTSTLDERFQKVCVHLTFFVDRLLIVAGIFGKLFDSQHKIPKFASIVLRCDVDLDSINCELYIIVYIEYVCTLALTEGHLNRGGFRAFSSITIIIVVFVVVVADNINVAFAPYGFVYRKKKQCASIIYYVMCYLCIVCSSVFVCALMGQKNG